MDNLTEEQVRKNLTNAGYLAPGAQSITSAGMEPVPALTYEQPKNTPVYPVAGLNADVTAPLAPTAPEQTANDLTGRLAALNDQLVGESAFRAEKEAEAGIPMLNQTQSDLSARLKGLQNEALAIPLQLQQNAQGRGITAGGLRPHETGLLRNNAIQALSTASLLEASRGNLTTAISLVDRAVAQRFDPIREQIATKSKNLDLILKSPEYSLADKNRAQKQLDIQNAKDRALKGQEEDNKIAQAMATAAVKNFPDDQAAQISAQQVLNLDPSDPSYLQKAFQLLGKFQADPAKLQQDLDAHLLTGANIRRINADIALTDEQRKKLLAETVPSAATATAAKQELQNNEALSIAKALREASAVGKSSAVGASFAKFVPFGQSLGLQGDRSAFEAKVDTLKASLTLDNLKLLKGAMSDKDLLFLYSIGSSLNVNMSEKQFDGELDRIIEKLEGAGATAGGVAGGTTRMTGPGGTFDVPNDKIEVFKQNGYN